MPTASAFSVNVKDYGVTTVIPDDDGARLMYYLNCVTVGVGLDILQDDLVRYKDYRLLSPTRLAVVFKTAVELSPELFIDKILFHDDKGDITGTSPNSFLSISAACDIVSLQSNIVIAGKVQNVTKVMFFKSSWLKQFYIDPIERITRAVLGTRHCTHCDGEDGICTCTTCARTSESKCQPLLGALLEALISPPSPSPLPASRPAPSPPPDDDKHQCNCDGCPWQFFTGIRYKCAVCDDYDLCSPCYNSNVHDLTHPFMQISKPGGRAIYLSARRKVVPSSNTSSPTTAKPATRSPPPRNPPPPTSRNPPSYAESTGRNGSSPSPFFYNSMSVTELRTYLTERGVEFDDVLDKETLCRRTWDAYCDCMTIVELNTFLSGRNISTVGCRDINSRRQKAKDAFESPSRPARPPASSDTSATRFMKDDMVVLIGLNRAEMNGNTATVISVDNAEGKALVRVEALDRTFKIKLENLKMEDDLEAVEELE